MRRIVRPMMFCFSVSFVLLFLGFSVSANFSDYSDAADHWAADNLKRAHEEGFLLGFEDNTIRPDDPISEAQVLTMICRVWNAQNRMPASALGLSGTEWYADAAGQAAAMNLISDGGRLSKESFSRLDAFLLLSRAFQLTEADPDKSPLQGFTDLKQMTGAERRAILSLLDWGVLEGYDDHTLRPQGSLSRAEFISMLYRIVPYQKTVSELEEPLRGGVLLSKQIKLEDKVFSFPVYLDCETEQLSLEDVTASRLVIRSQKTGDISLGGGNRLDVLVLAGGTGTGSTIFPSGTSSIHTLVAGDHNGALTVKGNVKRLEVTGNGQNITVNTALDELVLSGMSTRITLGDSGSIRTVRLTEDSSLNILSLDKTVSLILDGTQNKVSATGLIETLSLYGRENELNGSGSVRNALIYTAQSTVSLSCEQTEDHKDRGITDVSLSLSAPEILPIGETLTVTATLQNPEARQCTARWIVGGTVVKEDLITVGPQKTETAYLSAFTYHQTMNTNFQILFQLLYTTQDGIEQTVSASAATALENYSLEYYKFYSKETVLSRVTTGYKGDYTLSWAEKNDYDTLTKEIWTNAKAYGSRTNYLIWISISHQRVNVFEGSQGNWTLSKCFLAGTGAKGTNTPVGIYTVGTRSINGWTTNTYNVRPVIRFKMGSGLAFHSRIYDPKYTRITDGSIGYPVSHGCIRMYDEDVWWMYYNIPQETTVVVF